MRKNQGLNRTSTASRLARRSVLTLLMIAIGAGLTFAWIDVEDLESTRSTVRILHLIVLISIANSIATLVVLYLLSGIADRRQDSSEE
jgi:hypothetical protein